MFLTEYNKPILYPIGANIDKLIDEIFETSFKDGISKYPATDIYTENGVTHIEIAVTGFDEDDISVTLDNDTLIIKASKEEKYENTERNYHTKNIAKRSFIRKFTISYDVNDIHAEIKNGLLHLEIKPKEKEDTIKQIKINKK